MASHEFARRAELRLLVRLEQRQRLGERRRRHGEVHTACVLGFLDRFRGPRSGVGVGRLAAFGQEVHGGRRELFAMQETFDKLDIHEDLILPRQEFIDALRQDIRILKILHKPAIYLSKVDRSMTLDRLLY